MVCCCCYVPYHHENHCSSILCKEASFLTLLISASQTHEYLPVHRVKVQNTSGKNIKDLGNQPRLPKSFTQVRNSLPTLFLPRFRRISPHLAHTILTHLVYTNLLRTVGICPQIFIAHTSLEIRKLSRCRQHSRVSRS